VLKFSQIFAIEQQRAASGWRAYGACGRKRASRPVRRGRRFRGDSRRHPGASGDDTALFSSAGGGWRGAIQGRLEKRSRPSPDVGTPDRPAGPGSRTGQPDRAATPGAASAIIACGGGSATGQSPRDAGRMGAAAPRNRNRHLERESPARCGAFVIRQGGPALVYWSCLSNRSQNSLSCGIAM